MHIGRRDKVWHRIYRDGFPICGVGWRTLEQKSITNDGFASQGDACKNCLRIPLMSENRLVDYYEEGRDTRKIDELARVPS